MPVDYSETMNLPKTEFGMRANLPSKEPGMLEDWKAKDLYHQVLKHNEDKPLFVLHDGPPYANGDIHMGTAMNKILKDIIVRYKNMTGYCAPYVPGWDTHGLPIELKALTKAGDRKSSIQPLELRKLCREFALHYVDNQSQQFQRLGVVGDFENPYLTLRPEFEARQIEIFGEMAKKGYIYKGLKAVYWCPIDKTALAEAEIEYQDDPCDSVYVTFNVTKDNGILAKLGVPAEKTRFVIWTTTTWTLPANVAICLGADFDYAVVKAGEAYYVLAEALAEETMHAAGIEEYEIVASAKGRDFERIETQHPFLDRKSLVILGSHVTLESGTGCVHTAPGHGVEDFEVCTKFYPELPVVVPVDEAGVLTEEAGSFKGLYVQDANPVILEQLRKNGNLFAVKQIVHQYPHCWRCHHPVIFRATEQWFCSVDGFKKETMEAVKSVKWVPAWGENRMLGMVKDRNDWCISRQRTWGVPIPAFYCKKCGKYHINDQIISAVSQLFRKEGSDAWYRYTAAEIVPDMVCECGGTVFEKERDIMDVWFDSGSSHVAVCQERPELTWPVDLYLEGGDQYRGWFQSSLLTSVACYGKAPYKGVVSCGWVVDGQGRKMSKSLGNGVDPSDVIKVYGADIVRLWVAASDYQVDVRISDEILKTLSEAYRKIRNTARFILGNLYDFDPDRDMVADSSLEELDIWALEKLDALAAACKAAYEAYDFHVVFQALRNFCVVDMSNFYLDVIKDRLYVNKASSLPRRAAQTAMYRILTAVAKLISPILAFTSQEIWQHLPKQREMQAYILMEQMPQEGQYTQNDAFHEKWERLIAVRGDVQKALEEKRNEKVIGKSLEAAITLFCTNGLYEAFKPLEKMLAEICIVSKVHVEQGCGGKSGELEGLGVLVEHAAGKACARCWSYTDDVDESETHPGLCKRCAAILGQ